MKTTLAKVAAGALAVFVGGFLVTWSGIVNIGASTGHWPGMGWFLQFAMRQAVETHARGIDVPALDDPGMVLRGAAHYATGCAPCHGEPGNPRTPIVRHMTPPVTFLPPIVEEWKPNELYWMVRHGLKYTGMPGWVAPERPDEVWSVVAFLLRLPELDEQTYKQLAYGEAAVPGAWTGAERLRGLGGSLEREFENCVRCHGSDGAGRGGAFPKLAGQSERYLYASLESYAEGDRASGIMEPAASALSDAAMRRLAAVYAQMPAPSATPPDQADEPALKRGAIIALLGIPDQGVPACAHCHGPGAVARNALFPELAGQPEQYLRTQLELLKTGRRGGTPYAPVMHAVARNLEAQQMHDVAAYFASLESR
ncbi:MAG: c-type cytochrome [Gammaproteobacteria bacterium]